MQALRSALHGHPERRKNSGPRSQSNSERASRSRALRNKANTPLNTQAWLTCAGARGSALSARWGLGRRGRRRCPPPPGLPPRGPPPRATPPSYPPPGARFWRGRARLGRKTSRQRGHVWAAGRQAAAWGRHQHAAAGPRECRRQHRNLVAQQLHRGEPRCAAHRPARAASATDSGLPRSSGGSCSE